MNKIINKFLLTRDNFMPELHKRELAFIYLFIEMIKKYRENGDLEIITKIS